MNPNASYGWSQTAKTWGPVIGWMVLIFWFSTDDFSSDNTSQVFGSMLERFFPAITAAQLEALHLIIRKLGHWSEYFMLAVLALRALAAGSANGLTRHHTVGTIAFVFIYALSDEWHQSFVPSRSASLADVLLDTFGGISGTLFRVLRHSLIQRKI